MSKVLDDKFINENTKELWAKELLKRTGGGAPQAQHGGTTWDVTHGHPEGGLTNPATRLLKGGRRTTR